MPVPDTTSLKSRNELVEEARRMGVERPERMTRVELRDEIVRRTVPESQQSEARGLFGVARSMLASVVESGLNLPEAARLIRGESTFEVPLASQTPVATVTLAEIYAAQGHKERALQVLADVLEEEPGHEEALRVKAELLEESEKVGGSRKARRENSRELSTVDAPEVAPLPGETTEYVPGGFVETTGEEIQTGRPPEVQTVVEPAPLKEVPPAPVLVLIQTEAGLFIYWELPDATLEHCSIDPNEGQAVVRVVGFSPEGARPQRREETVVLHSTNAIESSEGVRTGKLHLNEFGDPFAVRAALGWESDAGFLPFTVGRPFASLGEDASTQALAARVAQHLDESQTGRS